MPMFLGLAHHLLLVLLRHLLSLRLGHGGHRRDRDLRLDLFGIEALLLSAILQLAHLVGFLAHQTEFASQQLHGLGTDQAHFLGDGGIVKELLAYCLEGGLDVALVDGPCEFQKDRQAVVDGFLHVLRGRFLVDAALFHVLLQGLRFLHGADASAGGPDAGTEELHVAHEGAAGMFGLRHLAAETHECGLRTDVFLRGDLQIETDRSAVQIALRTLRDLDGLVMTALDEFGFLLRHEILVPKIDILVLRDALADVHGALHLPLLLLEVRFLLHLRHLLLHDRLLLLENFLPLFLRHVLHLLRQLRAVILHHGVCRVGDPQLADVRLDQRASEHDIEEDHRIQLLRILILSILRLSVLVVRGSELVVAEGVVGLTEFLKLLCRFWIIWILVRVAQASLLVVRLLDLA
mmetsp:Transcript_20953/g.58290  ORF Transcript_20953/g.58290 Transcript_20953/m.58290 type:complete len:406 (-) Transcript_20953:104-1321(-)